MKIQRKENESERDWVYRQIEEYNRHTRRIGWYKTASLAFLDAGIIILIIVLFRLIH